MYPAKLPITWQNKVIFRYSNTQHIFLSGSFFFLKKLLMHVFLQNDREIWENGLSTSNCGLYKERMYFLNLFGIFRGKNPFWGHRGSLKNIPKLQIWKSTFSDYNVTKLKVMKAVSTKEFNTKHKTFINNSQIREKVKIYL